MSEKFTLRSHYEGNMKMLRITFAILIMKDRFCHMMKHLRTNVIQVSVNSLRDLLFTEMFHVIPSNKTANVRISANTEARSCNNCCRGGKNKYYIL
jgi:hypothetical protein